MLLNVTCKYNAKQEVHHLPFLLIAQRNILFQVQYQVYWGDSLKCLLFWWTFYLLREQMPLNRKFLINSTDRLCVWSSAILFLHLCCIYLCTHKARRNIRDAEPKCVRALGSLLSNITSPRLHSSFTSVVIHIYYFPSFLCIAWQCLTVLGLVAGEAGAAKWKSKAHNVLLHNKSSLTFH